MATADTCGRYIAKLEPDDIVTGTPPMAFTFGLGGLAIFPMRFGASIRFLESPLPEKILEAINLKKVYSFGPKYMQKLLPISNF